MILNLISIYRPDILTLCLIILLRALVPPPRLRALRCSFHALHDRSKSPPILAGRSRCDPFGIMRIHAAYSCTSDTPTLQLWKLEPSAFPERRLSLENSVALIRRLYSWLLSLAINSSVSSDTHWMDSLFSSSLQSLAATSLIKNQYAGASKTPKDNPACFLPYAKYCT